MKTNETQSGLYSLCDKDHIYSHVGEEQTARVKYLFDLILAHNWLSYLLSILFTSFILTGLITVIISDYYALGVWEFLGVMLVISLLFGVQFMFKTDRLARMLDMVSVYYGNTLFYISEHPITKKEWNMVLQLSTSDIERVKNEEEIIGRLQEDGDSFLNMLYELTGLHYRWATDKEMDIIENRERRGKGVCLVYDAMQ